MVLGLSEVAAVLRSTPLAALAVQDGPSGALVVPGIAPDRSHHAWREAYALLPVTGRWPVLVDRDPSDLRDDIELADLDQEARSMDPWPYLHDEDDTDAADDDQVPLSFYTRGLRGVDVTADVLPPLPVSRQDLMRRAYDHVLSDPALTAQVLSTLRDVGSTDEWYLPDEVWLLLLPTAASWLAPPWIEFYGTAGEEHDLAAALWQWHHRWDTRLVAGWGTMLQLEVHRPPAPGDDAWTAARQILALGPNLEIHPWELAVAVPHSEAWFIHNRP